MHVYFSHVLFRDHNVRLFESSMAVTYGLVRSYSTAVTYVYFSHVLYRDLIVRSFNQVLFLGTFTLVSVRFFIHRVSQGKCLKKREAHKHNLTTTLTFINQHSKGHTHIRTNKAVHAHTHTHTHTHTQTHSRTQARTHARTHARRTHAHTHAHRRNVPM